MVSVLLPPREPPVRSETKPRRPQPGTVTFPLDATRGRHPSGRTTEHSEAQRGLACSQQLLEASRGKEALTEGSRRSSWPLKDSLASEAPWFVGKNETFGF